MRSVKLKTISEFSPLGETEENFKEKDMTVKELKTRLNNFPDNCIVMVCNLQDDSDESYNFYNVDGVDYAPESGTVVSIVYNQDKD